MLVSLKSAHPGILKQKAQIDLCANEVTIPACRHHESMGCLKLHNMMLAYDRSYDERPAASATVRRGPLLSDCIMPQVSGP